MKPEIVVENSFVEWTRDGLLRHPEFIGVRDDKRAREIRRDG
jgi:ATP-dependent DNA ligase